MRRDPEREITILALRSLPGAATTSTLDCSNSLALSYIASSVAFGKDKILQSATGME